MLTLDDTIKSSPTETGYNQMVPGWTIGDVIRKERDARGWSQTRLGEEAEQIVLGGSPPTRINKSTVSKVENDPYTSELGTVWRLLAALDLTFTDVERRIGSPPYVKRPAAKRDAPRGPFRKGNRV